LTYVRYYGNVHYVVNTKELVNMRERELVEKLKNEMGGLLDGVQVVSVRADASLGSKKQHLQADLVVRVKIGNDSRQLVFEVKHRGYPRELEEGIQSLIKLTESRPELVPVLAVPFISETGRRQVRDRGVNYIDLSGNAYIAFDNVLIHKTSTGYGYTFKKEEINIFSDKASLIVRELLSEPEDYHTVRALAERASVSVGWASEVLNELEERGYLDRKPRHGCRIRRIESLLDDWTDQYTFLGKNRVRSFFIDAVSLDEILDRIKKSKVSEQVEYALTVHAGAHLVAPFVQYNECHLYVGVQKDFERQVGHLVGALQLTEPRAGGNLHVARPYYEHGTLHHVRVIDGLNVVSDLQLYLDLARFPVRGTEQAEKILEHSGLSSLDSW
jgi:DNA-binding transcriptional regulator YhcF (GntR family)